LYGDGKGDAGDANSSQQQTSPLDSRDRELLFLQ
jgi:hypothetical protein